MHPSHDYVTLMEPLHTLFTTIADREELSIEEGLSLLTCYVFNELRSIRGMLLRQDVAHPEGRLWQAIAMIAHQLAHAPDGMPQATDEWLHPTPEDDDEGYGESWEASHGTPS